MSPLSPALLLAQIRETHWERPPPGSLQRGLVALHSPTLVLVLGIALVVLVLGIALWQRFRRRPS